MTTQLKPFNLEAAKAGAAVITRAGWPLTRFLCWDLEGDSPIVVVIRRPGCPVDILRLRNDGRLGGLESTFDLFMAPVTVTKWLAVVKTAMGYYYSGIYGTKELAERWVSGFAGEYAVIKLEQITFDE